MIKIGVIAGSTRPGRRALDVANWVLDVAGMRGDAVFELVDIQAYNLPLLDEPVPPSMGQYTQLHTKVWSAKIAEFDGFVFVTPEYNHGTSGALKNAIDFLFKEWNDKAAGFVSYGSIGGARAVESLRLVMGELMVADVRAQVMLTLRDDWQEHAFKPREHHEQALDTLLDQVVAWSRALKTLRHDAEQPALADAPQLAPELAAEAPPPGRRVGSM